MTHRLISDGDLVLFGTVGMRSFFDEESGFTAREVISAMEQLSGDFNVRINSGGGSAFDGIAIHNALKAHDGDISVFVEGIAASAASIIAMAGSDVVMRSGALMMIHDASGITIGTAEDHLKQAELLEKLDGELAAVYAAKGNGDRDHFKSLMDAETWLTGDEAVSEGLADRTTSEESDEPSAFAYEVYDHAPALLQKFTVTFDQALSLGLEIAADDGGETAAQSAPQPHSGKEDIMSDKGKAPADKRVDVVITQSTENGADNAPDLDQVRADAVTAERERIAGIQALSKPGCEKLISEGIENGSSPGEVAIAIVEADKKVAAGRLDDIKKDVTAAVPDVPDTAAGDKIVSTVTEGADMSNMTDEERLKVEWNASEELRAEFGEIENYAAYQKASAAGRGRVFGATAS